MTATATRLEKTIWRQIDSAVLHDLDNGAGRQDGPLKGCPKKYFDTEPIYWLTLQAEYEIAELARTGKKATIENMVRMP